MLGIPTIYWPYPYTVGQSYQQWLDSDAASRVVLVEPQPGEILGGWTAVGGAYANTFSRSWLRLVGTSIVPGGVYRRLDAIFQSPTVGTDLVEYVQRDSLADVDANPGSYYYNASTQVLYVNTAQGSPPSGGNDPDIYTMVMALFTMFFSTEPVDFVGGELYEPRVAGAPQIGERSDNPLFGVKSYPSGEVSFINADGLFDSFSRDWVWKNKLIRFYLGGGTVHRTDYQLVATVRIDDLSPGDMLCTAKIRNLASLLDAELPPNKYPDTWDRTKLGDGVEGTRRPILLGAKTNIPAILVDNTVGSQVYEIADPTLQVLAGVSAVRAVNKNDGSSTTLTETTHYTIDLTNCKITVTSLTYVASAYEIRVDATGQTDGAGGYLSTGGEILQEILLMLGEPASNITSDDFDQADEDAPAPLGMWIRDSNAAAEIVRKIETSIFGSLRVKLDGTWTVKVWSPDGAGESTLYDEDFVTWDPDARIESLFYGTSVLYDTDPATGSSKEASATDNLVRYATGVTDISTLETVLLNDSDAEILAQRYQLVGGNNSIEVEVSLRGLAAMTWEVFRRVYVNRSRAPISGGAAVDTPMDVLAITKALGPPGVRLRLCDMYGIGTRIGRWVASGSPNWAAADDEERSSSGFWCDSAGRPDPNDASSQGQSLWW